MIHFLVPAAGAFSAVGYLARDGSALAGRMRVITYEELGSLDRLPLGTWVFAGLDQLSAAGKEIAILARDALEGAGAPVRLLNDPRRVKLRYALLRAMHAEGLSGFSAVRASELRSRSGEVPRYPVFVRAENEHTGNLTPILHDRRALDSALGGLIMRGRDARELLVIGFCDTSGGDGLFRKYSAFVVGGRVLPRYLNLSPAWMLKHETRSFAPEHAREELDYLRTNPHREWLERAFGIAAITYGRADYGVLNGAPQLWEINTNPTIGRVGGPKKRTPEAERYRELIAAGRAAFYDSFREAWEAVDDATIDGTVELMVPPSLRRSEEAERARRTSPRTLRAITDRLAGRRWARALKRTLDPALDRMAPFLGRWLA